MLWILEKGFGHENHLQICISSCGFSSYPCLRLDRHADKTCLKLWLNSCSFIVSYGLFLSSILLILHFTCFAFPVIFLFVWCFINQQPPLLTLRVAIFRCSCSTWCQPLRCGCTIESSTSIGFGYVYSSE